MFITYIHIYTHTYIICTKLRIQGSCPVRQSPLPKLNLGFDFSLTRWTCLWLSPLGNFIGAPTGNSHKCPWPSLSMIAFMFQVLCKSSFNWGNPHQITMILFLMARIANEKQFAANNELVLVAGHQENRGSFLAANHLCAVVDLKGVPQGYHGCFRRVS